MRTPSPGLRPAAALLAWLWLAWCPAAGAQAPCVEIADLATGDEDGIGGTGLGDEDGIGGTGFGDESAIGDDSGIGGTGIYGTITGLGSICVNGLRIHYDEDAPVSLDGRPAGTESLAVGRVVWLHAEQLDGRLWASELSVESAVRGTVEAVSEDAQRLRVAGIEIELAPGAILPDPAAGGAGFAPGDAVEVSGLWRDPGRVVASRIDRAGSAEPRIAGPPDFARRAAGLAWLSIEGVVAAAADPGGLRLGGLRLEIGPDPAPAPGSRVWVRGRLRTGGILAPLRLEKPTGAGVDRPGVREPPSRPKRPDTRPRPPRRQRPEPPTRIDRPPSFDRVEPIDRAR